MGFSGWTSEYSLGIPAVDADHRRLFALIEEFRAAVAEGLDRDEARRRLARLVAETAEHFAREERMLDRSDYPGLVVHRAEHQRLLAELRHIDERFAGSDGGRAGDFGEFLLSWLRRHILDDRTWRPFVMRLT